MDSAKLLKRAIELALSGQCEGIADIKRTLIWEGYVSGPGQLFKEETRELLRAVCARSRGQPQQWGRRKRAKVK
jgi:hypothetical protein